MAKVAPNVYQDTLMEASGHFPELPPKKFRAQFAANKFLGPISRQKRPGSPFPGPNLPRTPLVSPHQYSHVLGNFAVYWTFIS